MTDPLSERPALRIGTRGSRLARWQADWVAERLRRLGQPAELLEISTHGDVQQAGPIEEIGAPGVFTKAIQRALLAGEVDVAVHSLKDLPTDSVDGLLLAVVPPREDPADVLVSNVAKSVAALPRGARVGTGSLRRQAQLRHLRPDLVIENVRGNVDTRLEKLDAGRFDALVLAKAGLARLGCAERITQVLLPEIMLPAVGQGALGIECRADDAATRAAVAALDDGATHAAVLSERALLAHLRGGCLAPVGAWGRFEGGVLHLSAVVLSSDGRQRLEANGSALPGDGEALGRRVAESLLAQGAAELIAAARRS
jgi:hydroxymethylbilane synthase